MSDYRGSRWIGHIFGPFYWARVSRTCRLARHFLASLVAFRNVKAHYNTNKLGGESSVSRGYALKTNNVGTRPLGLAELLTAFIASCNFYSFVIRSPSSLSIMV